MTIKQQILKLVNKLPSAKTLTEQTKLMQMIEALQRIEDFDKKHDK